MKPTGSKTGREAPEAALQYLHLLAGGGGGGGGGEEGGGEGGYGVDACMTREGYPEWEWTNYLLPVTPEDPLTTTTWFAAPFSRWSSQALLASRSYLINEQAFNNEEDPRMSALRLCNHEANSQPEPQTRPGSRRGRRGGRRGGGERGGEEEGGGGGELTRRWWNAICAADDDQVPDESLYYRCMDDADITMLKRAGLEIGDVGPAMSAVSPNDQDIPADATDARGKPDLGGVLPAPGGGRGKGEGGGGGARARGRVLPSRLGLSTRRLHRTHRGPASHHRGVPYVPRERDRPYPF